MYANFMKLKFLNFLIYLHVFNYIIVNYFQFDNTISFENIEN